MQTKNTKHVHWQLPWEDHETKALKTIANHHLRCPSDHSWLNGNPQATQISPWEFLQSRNQVCNSLFKEAQLPIWKGTSSISQVLLGMFIIEVFFYGLWRMQLINRWYLRGKMNQIWFGLTLILKIKPSNKTHVDYLDLLRFRLVWKTMCFVGWSFLSFVDSGKGLSMDSKKAVLFQTILYVLGTYFLTCRQQAFLKFLRGCFVLLLPQRLLK